METHSSILAWRIPWTEEPGRLQSMELGRLGHDSATNNNFQLTEKLHRELLCTLHPASSNVSLLYHGCPFDKTRKLTQIQYRWLNFRLPWDFIRFSAQVPFLFQDLVQNTALHLVLQCFFFFLMLFLKWAPMIGLKSANTAILSGG